MDTFTKQGIAIYTDAQATKVSQNQNQISLTFEQKGKELTIQTDKLLVAVGRKPNTSSLNLEDIGVNVDEHGISHNEKLQTNIPSIYVAGDVTGKYYFTHYAGAQGAHAVRNICIPVFKSAFKSEYVPWVTFTQPEIAQVGLTELEAIKKKSPYRTVYLPYDKIDRAISEGQTQGFISLLVNKNKIIGAQIVGERAGELIHEVMIAIDNKISLRKLASSMHIYPTYSSGIQTAILKDFRQNHPKLQKFAKFIGRLT
jgi:pyruvate/2-oxoglutarate dehydrogenase complex dihydrolipoamide dehydrogenase (E3) component